MILIFLPVVGAMIAAVAAVVVAVLNLHKTNEVHLSLNSRLDKLLELTASTAKAEAHTEIAQAAQAAAETLAAAKADTVQQVAAATPSSGALRREAEFQDTGVYPGGTEKKGP